MAAVAAGVVAVLFLLAAPIAVLLAGGAAGPFARAGEFAHEVARSVPRALFISSVVLEIGALAVLCVQRLDRPPGRAIARLVLYAPLAFAVPLLAWSGAFFVYTCNLVVRGPLPGWTDASLMTVAGSPALFLLLTVLAIVFVRRSIANLRKRYPPERICPHCAYSLRGLSGAARCPECGHIRQAGNHST